MASHFKIGDIIEGEVTGIQNYGVFVNLTEEEQGLVHISECKHGYMGDINDFVKIGDKVKVVVIDIDEYTKKFSLSMRALEKINVPSFPQRSKKRKKRNSPKIGFKTIEEKMPSWIEEALESIDKNEFNTKVEV
ncbi:S1 RNA-binding domain-containing protein [Facklamia sp. DSM 111018]|uniref:S1 RNA-binding domain-containing protein n=1 Tax=Facklamia lactis TaxID=2749967 RepID=A0ABS0LR20_9LACT|nr:CvfD/Ygs/GSP13 family RNA-binding post-transcriptional regulator [Facklamia lactis]MBG9981029.1 S1 RNA-binding domain-containing protein [Facklamia lactis]MBG9986608.1 S1 RNA-binding domain-containing protein [Facklamia lactis]